jgi:hypothetical protein
MKTLNEMKSDWGLERYLAALHKVSRFLVVENPSRRNFSQEELQGFLDREGMDAIDVLAAYLLESANNQI